MFRVGMKVTMIAPHNFRFLRHNEVQPVFGEIYTIRGIVNGVARPGLTFEEIRNPKYNYSDSDEAYFNASRFRPIVSRPTSIEFAHEILRKATRTDEVSA